MTLAVHENNFINYRLATVPSMPWKIDVELSLCDLLTFTPNRYSSVTNMYSNTPLTSQRIRLLSNTVLELIVKLKADFPLLNLALFYIGQRNGFRHFKPFISYKWWNFPNGPFPVFQITYTYINNWIHFHPRIFFYINRLLWKIFWYYL